MKKIKITLTWDEMNAMLNDMLARVDTLGATYEYKLAMSVLMEWCIQLQPKLMFRKHKPFKLQMKVSTAIALILFILSQQRDASIWLDNVYIRLNNTIQQQLA